MDLSAAALQDFEADVIAAANARGVELTADDIQEVFARTVQSGSFTPLAMRAVLDEHLVTQGWSPDDDDEDYEEEADEQALTGLELLAEHFHHDTRQPEQRIGRKLSDAELDHLGDVALNQAGRHNAIDIHAAFDAREERLNTTAGRHELYRQRLGEQAAQDHEERVEQMTAGRSFDLDNDQDRRDYMVARLSGAEFQDAGGDED